MPLGWDHAGDDARPADGASGDPWVPALERVLRGQGFVDLKHGSAVGYEALSRFEAPEGIGNVAPPAWFEAAQRLGIGAEFEARVVTAALDARDRLPPNTFLTVNLSPWVVDTPPVRRVLEGPRGLHRVVIEITENAAVAEYSALDEAFVSLRGRGAYPDHGRGSEGDDAAIPAPVRPDGVRGRCRDVPRGGARGAADRGPHERPRW